MDSRRHLIWALWTLVTALGYSLGVYAGFFLAHFPLGWLIGVLTIGAAVGVAQRPVLQGYLEPRRSRTWTPMESLAWVGGSVCGTAVAFAVGWVLAQAASLQETAPAVLALAAALGVGGTIAGLLQERVLRRYVLDTYRWIVASAVGWASSSLGLALVPVLEDRVYDLFVLLLAPAAAGAILGLITGAVLIRLPMRPQPHGPVAALPSH